ncbi:MAG TPA: TetR/AcrR family transcriptional regulator [Micromonosporaceae bacterium]
MPRVSAEHLSARRQQILDAAAVCFARNGFHATSMQDVISQAGLSVGAVYRYFKSKDELRTAVGERYVGAVTDELTAVAYHEPALAPAEAMARALDVIEPRLAPDGAGQLALQMWAEAIRNPEVREFVAGTYAQLRDSFIMIARRAKAAGHVAERVDADALGLALFTLLPGYMIQRLMTGRPDRPTMVAAVRALLGTMSP